MMYSTAFAFIALSFLISPFFLLPAAACLGSAIAATILPDPDEDE